MKGALDQSAKTYVSDHHAGVDCEHGTKEFYG
jgi:hypothetical protein